MNDSTEEHTTKGKSLDRDEDYYFENGLLVMTARFHLRRGYCCGNLCRHCPFAHVAVPQSKHKTTASDGTAARRSIIE